MLAYCSVSVTIRVAVGCLVFGAVGGLLLVVLVALL